jgi:hypothetical protein
MTKVSPVSAFRTSRNAEAGSVLIRHRGPTREVGDDHVEWVMVNEVGDVWVGSEELDVSVRDAIFAPHRFFQASRQYETVTTRRMARMASPTLRAGPSASFM